MENKLERGTGEYTEWNMKHTDIAKNETKQERMQEYKSSEKQPNASKNGEGKRFNRHQCLVVGLLFCV